MLKVDPITFAVVRNKLISIANGMLDTASIVELPLLCTK